jgi:hypothetical protein
MAPRKVEAPRDPAHKDLEVTVDTTTVRESAPEVSTTEARPHACYEGLVFVGHLVEEDGEEVEAFTAYPCSRCAR